jgi:hypothetical protein
LEFIDKIWSLLKGGYASVKLSLQIYPGFLVIEIQVIFLMINPAATVMPSAAVRD